MRARTLKHPCPHGRDQPPQRTHHESARAPPAHVTREAPFLIPPGESEDFARLCRDLDTEFRQGLLGGLLLGGLLRLAAA
jgi:hypothetical protein